MKKRKNISEGATFPRHVIGADATRLNEILYYKDPLNQADLDFLYELRKRIDAVLRENHYKFGE